MFGPMLARAALVVALLAPTASAAPQSPPRPLQPATYASPDGRLELHVQPLSRFGEGPGSYRMTRGGEELWSGERPFTFHEACVADSGLIAGYAYTEGFDSPRGEFVVAVLAADGRVLSREATERTSTRIIHGYPDPKAAGMFLHQELDRFVVRVLAPESSSADTWWVHTLSTGAAVEKREPLSAIPDAEHLRWCLGARSVAGTPLTLAGWWRSESDSVRRVRRTGVRFVLLDAEWSPVWELELPTDYDGLREERSPGEWTDLLQGGAILDTAQSGRFELRHVAEGLAVTYAVLSDRAREGSWDVREVDRRPLVWDADRPPPPGVVDLELEHLGTVEIGGGEEAAPGLRVEEFFVDDQGRVHVVRETDEARVFSASLLSSSGETLRETTIGPLAPEIPGGVIWEPLGGGRWLALISAWGPDVMAAGFIADETTGELRALEGFDCPAAEAAAAIPGGGFVVLGNVRTQYTSNARLRAFDAAGRMLWEVEDSYQDPALLFRPQDIAVTSEGLVAVLESSGNLIKVYRPDGSFESALELERVFAAEPNYVSGIEADPEGGVWVYDFDGEPPLWHLALDGELYGKLSPLLADGSAPGELPRLARPAPDGRLWTSDRQAIYRLGEDGVVDRVLGRAPDPDRLTEPAVVAMGLGGELGVFDERTGRVHVFDAHGQRLRVCHPDPTDFVSVNSANCLALGPDGSVLVERDDDFLRFDPEGRRVGRENPPGYSVRFDPSGSHWVYGHFEAPVRMDAEGAVLDRMEKRPDGRWFEVLGELDVDSRGALAVLEGKTGLAGAAPPLQLSLFDEELRPLRVIDLPPGTSSYALTYGGTWAAMGYRDERGHATLLLRTKDDSFHRVSFDEALDREGWWHVFFPPAAGELWAVDLTTLRLERFRLPE